MKHTPGPWGTEYDFAIVMAGQVLGMAPAPDGASRDEIVSNAKLIAAAPTMLQALLDIRLSIMMGADGGVTDTAWIVNSVSETIIERIDGILVSLGYDPEKLGDE